MCKYCVNASDERFFSDGDAATIQNAVDYAAKEGLNRVEIPRYNARTGETVWTIEKAIILPGNMTVVLKDAHLRLADGVFDNIFRTANWMTKEGKTLEGELSNIRILGEGNALLDGGVHNGLVEQMHRDNPEKYPRLSVNLLIFMVNTRDFEISGLNFINARWWSICCIYCRFGRIMNLDFKFYGTSENQDGVDLRVGCEFITIENISGITGDDTVAMTALPLDDLVPETDLKVEGKRPDIHDITIRNIVSSSHGCYVIRFLCEDGARIYNVTVDGLKDTGATLSGAAVTFGITDTYFAKDHPRVMGDFRNITLRNISTCAQKGIQFCEPCQDVTVENLNLFGVNECGLRIFKNFRSDNVVVRNMNVRSDAETFDSVVWARNVPEEAFEGLTIENVNVTETRHVFRDVHLDIKNLKVQKCTEEEYVEDPDFKLASAYGRYHMFAFGKVIENRPKDNRIDGTLKKN